MERVYHVEVGGRLTTPPRPRAGEFNRLEEFGAKVAATVGKTVPLNLDQAAEMYRGDRRYQLYQAALKSLQTSPLCPQDAHIKMFVKAEKIDLETKSDPAPRAIQPRAPRYNLAVGRFLRPIEKKIYDGIEGVYADTLGSVGPIVMKGLTAFTTADKLRAKWDRFRKPVAIGLDASRFDQHVSPDALRWEHGVYTRCFYKHDAAELETLLSWQLRNYGSALCKTAKFRYVVDGCRMSGDMNTSLGNCLIMCGLVWLYCKERGVVADLANNGDDCVVIMERSDVKRFSDGLSDWFTNFGFTMKVEDPVDQFERIEFCRMRPVWANRWVMCRSMASLSKDCYSLLPWAQGSMAYGWATAIGDSGLAVARGVPVFEAVYNRLKALGRGITLGNHPLRDQGGLYWMSKGVTDREPIPVTDQARVSFWLAFDIMPSDQMILESMSGCVSTDLDTRGVSTTDTCCDLTPSLRHITSV
jgi:hypothetical protein